MLNFFGRAIYNITIFFPAYLAFAFVGYKEEDKIILYIAIVLLFISILFFIFLFCYAKNKSERINFKFISAENIDIENLKIGLLCFIPLIDIGIVDINITIFIFFIFTIVIILACIPNFPYHPLFFLFRFHFYKVTNDEGISYVLVTKKLLKNTDKSLTVIELNKYTRLDIK